MKKSVDIKTRVPVIKRSVELIKANHSLTIIEHRLLLLLLSKVSSFDEIRGRWIGVSGLEYIELFGNHGNIYTFMKEAAKSFLEKPIIINKDDGSKEKFTIASGVRLPPKTGTIEIEFHREMIPHISNLKKKRY